MSPRKPGAGGALGILVFLLGIGLLGVTFWRAFELFGTPPEIAVGLKKGEPIDLNTTGSALIELVSQALFLLVMCVVGSVIASRGIKMYGESQRLPDEAA